MFSEKKKKKKKRNLQYFKRKQDGLDEIGVFQSLLGRTAWVIYRRIIFWIEDSSINFSFHQELLFRMEGRKGHNSVLLFYL